ncbi:MAG: phosphatase [Clostridiales bacterium]|jgi:putative hydrolase|nr:phosphatase [Clostridiales bacterium]
MIIRLDAHTHTVASDHAYSTALENCAAAAKAGMEAIGMTDHAPPLYGAPSKLHFANLNAVDREVLGVTMLRGAELNIMDANGSLFLKDEFLKDLDYCIASVHPLLYAPAGAGEGLWAYAGAMKNPRVKIIGHPEDARVPVDFDELARAASDTLTLIEVNNSSLRAGSYRMNTHANMAKMLRACERHGVFVSLGSDAHFATAVGRFGEALQLLSELDFPEELVASTSLDKFRALIGRKA